MGLVLIGFSQSSTSIVMTLGLCVLAPVLLTRGAPAPLRLFSYLAGVAGAGIAVWAMAVFQLDPVEIALDAPGKERTLTGRSRSDEHTSELKSLMRISYAVVCL